MAERETRVITHEDGKKRCPWPGFDPLYVDYHDTEWGVPQTDKRALFEMLCLEGQQAGLSWITVLKKRENYRQAFHDFDPQAVALMDEADLLRLLLIGIGSAILYEHLTALPA